MQIDLSFDGELARRLPLPLAQLYRRAHNAKSPDERHHAAYYLWEAALKLLGAAAVASYIASGRRPDPKLSESLQKLARPSVGQWWEIVRALVVELADGDPGFEKVRDLLLGPVRDDLPRVAGLDAALLSALDGGAGARATVRLTELFDRLVRYRNREFGHGAVGQRPAGHYDEMGRALLAGVPQLLGRLDVLAGRRLVYLADARRLPSGAWLVQRYELTGEAPQRLEALETTHEEAAALLPQRVYLAGTALLPLHPLVAYDFEADEASFLNARRGKRRVEYLSYTSGRVFDRVEAASQNALLAELLDMPVDEARLKEWQDRSREEEGPAGEPASARRLGEFELLSELGRGNMGVVYRAWQPSLGRQVALKSLLRPGDPKAETRFRREIAALGHVEHPHVARILTSGAEGDQWFYAMELVEGATLAAVCDRLQQSHGQAGRLDLPTWRQALSTVCEEGRRSEKPAGEGDALPSAPPAATLPPTEAPGRQPPPGGRDYVRHTAGLMRQIAEAANALHEKGVVHRDVKPGNIMVSPDGATATLMDLGLAQVADDVEGRLTRTRQFVGTLRYASPEQVLAVGRLDRRSDVYSLGATLWELLTLRPLYGATEQTPTPELMQRIQIEEPGRVRRHNPAVPRDLEAVVQKCLEKDPKKRYATAAELAHDLERFLAGEPVRARPVRGPERLWKWARRRPTQAALIGMMILAVVGLMVGAWVFAGQAELKRQQAENFADEEGKRLKQIEKANEILTSVFHDLDPRAEEKEGLPLSAQLGERLDRAAELLEGDAVGDPLVVARLQLDMGEAQENLGYAQRAIELFTKSCRTFEAKLGPDDPDTLESMNRLAIAYGAAGQSDKAMLLSEQVLEKRKAKLGPDHPDTLRSMNGLAIAYKDAGQLDKAIPLYEETLEKFKAKLGPDHPDTLTSMNNLAIAYGAAGQLDKAMLLSEQVLEKRKAKLGPDHPDTLRSMNNLATAYQAAGQSDKALPLFEQALEKSKAKLGPDHPDTLESMNNLALAYGAAGQLDKAVLLSEQVLEKFKAKLGPDHPQTLTSMNNLAIAYGAAGRLDKALPLYEETLEKFKAKLGPDHPNTLNGMNNLATAYQDAGQLDKAIPLYEQMLEKRKAKVGPDHPNTLTGMNNLARAYQDAGQLDKALPLYEQTLEKRKAKLGPDHPDTLTSMNDLATAYQAAGQLDKAIPLYEQMLEKRKAKLGPDHPDTLTSIYNLATALLQMKQYDRAVPLLRDLLGIQSRQLPADDPALTGTQALLGLCLLQADQPADAEPILRECLALREKKLPPDDWRIFSTKALLGGSLLGQKKYADAEPLLREGYEGMKAREKTIPPQGKVRLTEALERLVQLYEATDQKEKAAERRKELQDMKPAQTAPKP